MIVRANTQQFGEWLRKARRAAGMTQQNLAERCSVRKGAVSAWETGKQRPSAARLRTIHELYGPFGGTPEPQVADDPAPYGDTSVLVRLSPEEMMIVRVYRRLMDQGDESA